MGSKFLATSMPGPASTGSVRSRSISPYGSATAGTPSSRDSPSSEFNNGNKEESSAALNGHLLLHNANNNQEMTTSNGSINTNSSMNGSIPPDSDLESESGGQPNNKSGIDATPRPNIKALTNKQRNWFSSFEKGRSVENVDSARRTSVKSDNTPSLLSGGAATESPSGRDPDAPGQPESSRRSTSPERESLLRFDRGLPQKLEKDELRRFNADKTSAIRRVSFKRQRK